MSHSTSKLTQSPTKGVTKKTVNTSDDLVLWLGGGGGWEPECLGLKPCFATGKVTWTSCFISLCLICKGRTLLGRPS